MEKITEIEIYNISNKHNNTRSGFSHTAAYSVYFVLRGELHREEFVGRCFYYNRTWERKPYDSSRKFALSKALDFATERCKTEFLAQKCKQRMTRALKGEFEGVLQADALYQAIRTEIRKIDLE